MVEVTQAEAITLEPCPFCGGEAALDSTKGPTRELYETVICSECGASGPCSDVRSMQDDEAHPIDAWNTRTEAVAALEARVRELEGVLKPFADKATEYEELWGEWKRGKSAMMVMMKHLIAARKALHGPRKG